MDDKAPEKSESSPWAALSLAWELGYMIALPIAILGFVGAYLDKKFGTGYWFLIGGIILSLIVSATAVYRKVKNLS